MGCQLILAETEGDYPLEQARQMAPELEELAFWQAMQLADNYQDFEQAVAIFKPVLTTRANREAWVDLVQRIQTCGILKGERTADRFMEALSD